MSSTDRSNVPRSRKTVPKNIVNGAGSVRDSPKKLAEKVNREIVMDFGEAKGPVDEINFGIVETPASMPHLDALKMAYSWRRYARQTQITILSILLLVIIIALAAEMIDTHLLSHQSSQPPKTYVKDVLGYVIPIFTFMLGMGSQHRDDK